MIKIIAAFVATAFVLAAEAQQPVNPEIQSVVSELAAAWNQGDAAAFAKRFQQDGTLTNVNGTTLVGHAAFEERHRAIFAGPLKGSVTTMTVRRAQLVRPDVAPADVDCSTKAGAPDPIGSKLLLVLPRDAGQWSIAAFHNTPIPAAPIVR
ncbi:MAG: SgcJ/EcaC family oxidoreductase [Gammaproteobacteria bacterium]